MNVASYGEYKFIYAGIYNECYGHIYFIRLNLA